MRVGRRVFFGGVNFAEILAQFGRDVVQLQFGVDLFFGFSGDGFFVVELGEAVFA